MNDEILEMIQDCENREDQMSEWERDFIQSLSEQFSRKGSISPRQEEILDKIWDKLTSTRAGTVAKRGR